MVARGGTPRVSRLHYQILLGTQQDFECHSGCPDHESEFDRERSQECSSFAYRAWQPATFGALPFNFERDAQEEGYWPSGRSYWLEVRPPPLQCVINCIDYETALSPYSSRMRAAAWNLATSKPASSCRPHQKKECCTWTLVICSNVSPTVSSLQFRM